MASKLSNRNQVVKMRSQARYVLLLVALLTGFSLYTIVKHRPRSNFQSEVGDSTIGYDEAEELKFLEEGHEGESPALHKTIGRLNRRPPRAQKPLDAIEANQPPKQHLIDLINRPSEVDKFDFRSCRMSNCFNYSRCNSNDTLKVHIATSALRRDSNALNISGESNIIHQNILKIIRESKHFEPDPSKACLFLPEDDTLDRDPLSSSFRSSIENIFQAKYDFGMNYLIFNLYSGSWPDYKEDDFSNFKIGAAILAKASNGQAHHRPGFDLSIPLFSYLHPARQDDSQTDLDAKLGEVEGSKPYFLTFKGKRYVIGSGSETRNSLYHLNNQRDIVMLTTCRHGKKWRDIKDARCEAEEVSYNQYDFVDLMQNSTFCLTPRGRRLGSFRFLEALSCGCIPVILSDGWVWPFGEIIDWSRAALQFPEEEILLVPDQLRDIKPEQIARMRTNCLELYHKHFSSVEKIVLTTLAIIETRIRNKM